MHKRDWFNRRTSFEEEYSITSAGNDGTHFCRRLTTLDVNLDGLE